ncbi:uncharacterized protein LOC133371277 [Rhineura floridana]|uniref:uncharacterized protein LOC133371277 n=1 Tax=Rhineura floridana TaxID=261503 RepID=UPI002AC81D48|nr:uncharacterized protein LOC133371277 [Rhineura floridana]
MASREGFAAVFYTEPSVLGLLANVVSAFLVCLQNFSSAHSNIPPMGVENILAGVHLILIGGLSQLLAGLLTFRKYDHLGGTAFLAFAGLWSSYGATRIISGAYPSPGNATFFPSNASFLQPPHPSISDGAVAGLVAYIIISLLLSFCSATVNYIMPFVFGAITLALVFEAVGLFARWALVVSGVMELGIVACGIYGATALLLKGIGQRHVLPGFGNPLFNVLLLGSSSRTSAKNVGEVKKNTKYAEPMALTNLCDSISAFIFSFYSFGYMRNFYVGAVWVSINSIGHLLGSYYGYQRDDAYHTTKSGVHSLFWLVMSWEEFTLTVFIQSENVQPSWAGLVGNWFFLSTAWVLLLVSLNRDALEVAHSSLFVLLTVSTIQQIPIIFFGVVCSFYTAASLYATFASLINSVAEKALVPVGVQVMSTSKLQKVLASIKSSLLKSKDSPAEPTLSEIPSALFYISNGLAAFSALQGTLNDPIRQHLCIPTVLIPGAVFQLYVCRLQVQKGRQFGSVLSFCYAAVWATWTWFRFAGNLLDINPRSNGGFTAGAVAFLVVNLFLIILASYFNVVLLCLAAVMEVLILCFLLSTVESLPLPLEIAMLTIFSLICIYGATASLANCIFGKELILMGPPLLRTKRAVKESNPPPLCLCPSSQQTSGLRAIADKLDAGGVCGVPTDTVYALAASCRHPEAIEKIYRIKDRPQEKPICILISNLDQLRSATPPFSPLLWEFMENVYPGGIGCIVQKGEWLKKLGVGAVYDRVGTRDSIMIRVPDQTVTVHLIDMTGPLAITSANPSGETDSTHHNIVIERLGHKLEGVLCDGESNEVVASTVVNCTRIDEGGITILREGCVPAAKVVQIFEKVKNQSV